MPAIERYARVAEGIGEGIARAEGGPAAPLSATPFTGHSIIYADNSLFKIFSFPLLAGRPSLDVPGSAALSATMACRYP